MISFELRIIREQNRLYTLLLKLISKFQKGPEVYIFHDILEQKNDVKSDFTISRASFELFLLNKFKQGKKSITFQELTKLIEGKVPNDKHAFFVSFDDCNTSVFTKAYPFLKQHNIPFILFITKDLIGENNFLTAEQIQILANDSLCTIGSHGMQHVMFRYLSVEEVQKEFTNSKEFLEELTGETVTCFAFPYGRVVECSGKNRITLKHSVYDFAFSAIAGNLNQKWLSGKYYLPRINVSEAVAEKVINIK
jgi:peptidoglycan/xylan/chitin deacetylase (PgdA/CDA1 family)